MVTFYESLVDVTFFFRKKKVTKEKLVAAQFSMKGCDVAGAVLPEN
jgi:hypothetical protein